MKINCVLAKVDKTGNVPYPISFSETYTLYKKYFYRNRYEGFRYIEKIEFLGNFSMKFRQKCAMLRVYYLNDNNEMTHIELATSVLNNIVLKF